MIWHYLKVAVRQMWKYKSHQVISALCLAVGIICFSYMWMIIAAVNQAYELPYYERRVTLYMVKDNQVTRFLTGNEVLRLQEDLRPMGVKNVSASSYSYDGEVEVIDSEGRMTPYLVSLAYVNAYNFAYLDKTVQGLTRELEPYDVVLSASFARKAFGRENPVGKSLRFGDEATSFKIVGVADDVRPGTKPVDCYFSMSLNPDARHISQIHVILPENLDYEAFRQRVEQWVWQSDDGQYTILLGQISDGDMDRKLAQGLALLIASLILLSGMINFLKFVIQTFFNRQRELVLRKCMGSGLKGLYGLLASEVFLMMTLAFFLSLFLTEVVFALLNDRLPADFPILPIGEVYLIQCGVYVGILVVGLLAACFPMVRLKRSTLYAFLQSTRRKHTFRNWMIAVQLFISMFFLGGLIVINMLWDEIIFDGYLPLSRAEQSRVVVLPVNSRYMERNIGAVLDEVRRMPEVERVTYTNISSSIADFSLIDYPRRDGGKSFAVMQNGSPDYFAFFNIPMEGKLVSPDAGHQVYVSRRFKQLLDKEGYDGTVCLGDVDYQVAGVYEALFAEVEQKNYVGSVFFPSATAKSYYILVDEHTSVREFQERLLQLCRKFIPETLPVDIHLLPDDDETKAAIGMMQMALTALVVVSLLLVVLSIYSSISLDTQGRRKEVAIRKINGARPVNIFFLFAKVYLYIFAVTYVLACCLIYIVGIHIAGQFGSVRSWQWPVLLFVLITLLLAAVSGYKIWQVMRLNPAEVIKNNE